MMSDDELKLAIFAGEFEPKRLRLTNGETYEIRHPGSIAIGRRVTGIVVNGRLHQVSNLHIAQIEPLELAAS
jgi:hypothetical protein